MLNQVFEGKIFSSNIKNCYVTEKVPGKTIVEHLGLIHSIIEPTFEGYNLVKRNPIQVVLELLYQEALKHGANAVVNIRIITGSYGNEVFITPYIVAYGDAVVLKDILEENRNFKNYQENIIKIEDNNF